MSDPDVWVRIPHRYDGEYEINCRGEVRRIGREHIYRPNGRGCVYITYRGYRHVFRPFPEAARIFSGPKPHGNWKGELADGVASWVRFDNLPQYKSKGPYNPDRKWKPIDIDGLRGRYQISSDGLVKSDRSGKILKVQKKSNGFQYYRLYYAHGGQASLSKDKLRRTHFDMEDSTNG